MQKQNLKIPQKMQIFRKESNSIIGNIKLNKVCMKIKILNFLACDTIASQNEYLETSSGLVMERLHNIAQLSLTDR